MSLYILKFLRDSRRPSNLDQLGDRVFSQAGDHPLVAGGEITDSCINREILNQPRTGNDLYSRPDSIAVRFRAHGLNSNPVLPVPAIVAQHVSLLTNIADHDVHIAV